MIEAAVLTVLPTEGTGTDQDRGTGDTMGKAGIWDKTGFIIIPVFVIARYRNDTGGSRPSRGSWGGGGQGSSYQRRGRWGDQSSTYHEVRREEREKVACEGVPEVWALSPPRPDLE